MRTGVKNVQKELASSEELIEDEVEDKEELGRILREKLGVRENMSNPIVNVVQDCYRVFKKQG